MLSMSIRAVNTRTGRVSFIGHLILTSGQPHSYLRTINDDVYEEEHQQRQIVIKRQKHQKLFCMLSTRTHICMCVRA